MNKFILTLLLTVSLLANEYIVDKKQSDIRFEASKFLFVGVSGTFSKFEGSVLIDKDSRIIQMNGIVDINSINTKDEERDTHLKENDYFNIKQFPSIIFKSSKIINDKVIATIDIKGIKKELTFKIENIEITDTNLKFNLSSILNRQEFMLNGSMSAVIADNIDVFANIIARKK